MSDSATAWSSPIAERMLDPQLRFQHALDVAYRYLGHRDRTAAEMRRHLEAKRVEPDTIEQAMAELSELGYLDDARFAQRFVEDRRALDAWGIDRIERKLVSFGVGSDLIAAALSDRGPEDELGAALEVLRRRLRSVPETDSERERALKMLVRKGYELEVAYDAVRAFARDAPPRA